MEKRWGRLCLRVIYVQKVTIRIQRQQRNFLQEVCCTVKIKLSGIRTEVFRFWVARRISSSSVITSLLFYPSYYSKCRSQPADTDSNTNRRGKVLFPHP